MSPVWQASVVALWVFTLLIAVLLVGALRQVGLLQLRLGPDPGGLITDVGLDRGARIPDFPVIDPNSGAEIRFYDLPDMPRALILVSPTCMTCQTVLEALNEVAAVRGDEIDLVVICRDTVELCGAFMSMNHVKARCLVDPVGDAERALKVSLTPFVYVLDRAGRVLVRGVANDIRGLESLLDEEGTLQGGRAWVEAEEGVAVDGRSSG